MLNPNWLNTFVTLVDTGHFTKTADKLFMTQPGVSQHISKLEVACGHALILREKKTFEVTDQGLLVYQYAKQLTKNESELLEALTFDDPFSGHYTLATSGSIALILYPQLLDLQTLHPNLVVKLKAAPNYQILSGIQTGIIDIGICTHIENAHLFDMQVLGKEQLCLVFPSGVKTPQYDMNLLTRLGLIDHPDAAHYLSLYFTKNQGGHFSDVNIADIPISGYINQISQILEPVAKGLGFTVLPKSAIDSFHSQKKLTVFKPHKSVMESLYMVKKRNRVLPARFDTVNTKLKAILAM